MRRSTLFTIVIVLAFGCLLPSSSLAAFPGANGLIAYDAPGTGGSSRQIWTIDPDGSSATQLTKGMSSSTEATFSPDGSKIAYVTEADHIVVMSTDGTGPVDLTPSDGASVENLHPSFSPDGTKLAFERIDFNETSPRRDIWTMNASNGSERVDLTATAGENSREPSWSPSGAMIAFERDNEIWTMGSNGSNPAKLTSLPFYASAPAWSPDEEQISFTYNSGGSESDLWLISSDGTNQRQLTNTAGVQEYASQWSPDDTKLLVSAEPANSGELSLYTVDPATGVETPLPNTAGARDPAWQPLASSLSELLPDPTTPSVLPDLTALPPLGKPIHPPGPKELPILLAGPKLVLALSKRRDFELRCTVATGSACIERGKLVGPLHGKRVLLGTVSGRIAGGRIGTLTIHPSMPAKKPGSSTIHATLTLSTTADGFRSAATLSEPVTLEPLPKGKLPTAQTGAATEVSEAPQAGAAGSATVSAVIDPNGQSTAYHFEYGPVGDEYSAPAPDESAGSDRQSRIVTTRLDNLQPGVPYKYRVVAQSPGGIVYGSYKHIQVPLPVTAFPPTAIGETTEAGYVTLLVPTIECLPSGGIVTGMVVTCIWQLFNPQPPVVGPVLVRAASEMVDPLQAPGTTPSGSAIDQPQTVQIQPQGTIPISSSFVVGHPPAGVIQPSILVPGGTFPAPLLQAEASNPHISVFCTPAKLLPGQAVKCTGTLSNLGLDQADVYEFGASTSSRMLGMPETTSGVPPTVLHGADAVGQSVTDFFHVDPKAHPGEDLSVMFSAHGASDTGEIPWFLTKQGPKLTVVAPSSSVKPVKAATPSVPLK